MLGCWSHEALQQFRRPCVVARKINYNLLFSRSFASKVILSGIQPTGVPHLGNYLGALRQWVQLQKDVPSTTKLLYSIVDLHALTARQDGEQLRRQKVETLAALVACGLDPERCTIFYQSDVPAHSEMLWLLSCTASMGYLSRMTQWKSKLSLPENASPLDAVAKAKLKLGLFSYPVLQASDILVHNATHVPVGEDQMQHIEFARECANNFNTLYGDHLVKPQALLSPARRIMSLKNPTLKMSKSHEDPRSRILLSDSNEDIRGKVKLALTDLEQGISYDPVARPGVSNLLDILRHLHNPSISSIEVVASVKGLSIRVFKEHVAEEIIRAIQGIRERYYELLSEKCVLDGIIKNGAEKARNNAAIVLNKARLAVGID